MSAMSTLLPLAAALSGVVGQTALVPPTGFTRFPLHWIIGYVRAAVICGPWFLASKPHLHLVCFSSVRLSCGMCGGELRA